MILISSIGLNRAHPRVFWKEHQHEFPILASLARDILAIPASGAGVERLFNCARDICHYRRGQLKPETIRELMLKMCSSKFELEQAELDFTKEYLSAGEGAIIDQERSPVQPVTELEWFEPISDNEEDDEEDKDELPPEYPSAQSTQAGQKRPRSSTSESLDDEPQLPEMQAEESETQRRFRRKRRAPKMPDGFEIDHL